MVGWEGTIALDKASAARLDDTLERSALGDQFAFEQIVLQHQGMVFGMACHFLRDRSLAEELAQEVFLNLHQNLRSIKSPEHLVFWLRKVTSHRCIDQSRRLKVRPQVSLEDVPEPAIYATENDLFLSQMLRRVVDKLPGKAPFVGMLCYQRGLAPGQIVRAGVMSVHPVQ